MKEVNGRRFVLGFTSPKCKENCIVVLISLCCSGSEKFVNNLLPSLIPSLYKPDQINTQEILSRVDQSEKGWDHASSPLF